MNRPLQLAGDVVLTHREGLLLHDPQGGGWGEAAPLPGFSRETLSEVRSAAEKGQWTHPDLPSLRFAVDCASNAFVLGGEVEVNALWFPDHEPVEGFLQRLGAKRTPVVKIKMGPDPNLAPIMDFLRACPNCRLRLDANRRWTIEDAMRVLGQIPPLNLEYLEEPFHDPERYEDLWSRTSAPVALDESLLTPAGEGLAASPWVTAFVLKPTLMGGAADYGVWITLAERTQKTIIWSSSFESGVGLWHLAKLAQGHPPAGLDTAEIFAQQIVDPPPLAVNGRLRPPKGSTPKVCV
ncbi:MAG: hypothetical protein JJU29_02575 [Verrucomicrobia bacterium]|nr:hypothetical protein [Verrucomicrobiota bacterium]